MVPYHHYTYGAATQTAVLLYTERSFIFSLLNIRKIQNTVPPAASCQAERNFSALSALLGDLQSNLGRRKVEMMMLLKLNQQLIPGLADVLQQVADLKDATAAGNVVSLS